MNKQLSAIVGMVLILVGALALAATLGLPVLGVSNWSLWRLWPVIVLGAGLCFVLPPLLAHERRGLAALFIPGLPILTTGSILLFASVFDQSAAWSWLWPLEVLAVALGFLFAAIFGRWRALLVPAIIIGLNGVLLQFCALTGWWSSWAVLWTIEPLGVGLALLVLGRGKSSPGLFKAGLILCAVAAAATLMMASVMNWWFFRTLGPAVLVALGAWLLFRGELRWPLSTGSPTPE